VLWIEEKYGKIPNVWVFFTTENTKKYDEPLELGVETI